MKELINITEKDGNNVVSARELHEFLEVNSKFNDWVKRMFEYGFEEDIDFCSILSKSTGGRPSVDYALTLDCAKEISMLQRSDKGKQARKYFIECEKIAKQAIKQLSPAEQLLHNAQLLVQQEKRMNAIESEVKQIKAQVTVRPNYFTIVGYATLHGVSCGLKLASSLGRKATALCKKEGIETETIPDPRFGKIKTYPEIILRQIFENSLA